MISSSDFTTSDLPFTFLIDGGNQSRRMISRSTLAPPLGRQMSVVFGTTEGHIPLPYSFTLSNLDSDVNGSDDFNVITTGSLDLATGWIGITVEGSSVTVEGSSIIPHWTVDASHVITINTQASEIHSWFDGWGVVNGRIASPQLLMFEIDLNNMIMPTNLGLNITEFCVTTDNNRDITPRYIIDGVANVKLGAGNECFAVDIPLETSPANTRIGFTDGPYSLQSLTFQTYTIEDVPTLSPTTFPTFEPTKTTRPTESPTMTSIPTTTMGPTDQDMKTGLEGTRPNVILFLGDDQTIYDHGAYGNTKVPTQTTAAFANEALVFERAYTGQTLCAPSRSMLYTGRYPIRNGCFLNHRPIRPGIKTLPNYLQELGYKVVLAGKSHVSPDAQFPWDFQWDTVEVNGKPRDSLPFEMVQSFLANPGTDPFCLILASEYPHSPYHKNTSFTDADVILHPYLDDGMRQQYPRYYANIIEKEAEFERILELLDQNGMSDDAVVIYTDDHGAAGGKFSTYDRGTNVALMVRWPGRVAPGRTDQLVSFADFVPTMIDLAGGMIPCGLDGKSMLPLWVNRNAVSHEYLFAVSHRQGIRFERALYPQRSAHDGRYHYIFSFNSQERIDRENITDYFYVRGAQSGDFYDEELLFDTFTDKFELTNIADDPAMTEIKERLKLQLFKWMEEQNDFLSDTEPIPFFQVQRSQRLDLEDELTNYSLPEEQIGVLEDQLLDSHLVSNPNAWLDPSSSYARWITENDVLTSMYQDEDSDGVNNLHEFALAGDPLNKTDGGGVQPKVTHITDIDEFTQEISFVHVRRIDAIDELKYTIEVSDDEVQWTTMITKPTVMVVSPYSVDYELVTMTFKTPYRHMGLSVHYINAPTITPTSAPPLTLPTTSSSSLGPTLIPTTMTATDTTTTTTTRSPTAVAAASDITSDASKHHRTNRQQHELMPLFCCYCCLFLMLSHVSFY